MKVIEDHCFSETEVEVGGFLVGVIGEHETVVTNVFPAQHSVGASTQLTFTHESWNALYEQLKTEPEGTTLVGWYHSHPNFGVFLSEHDKFIQSNFFKQDGNVTIVVDPIKGRKGWFYSKNGKIEKYKNEVDTDRPRLGVSATDSAANIGAKLSGGGVSLRTVVAISAVMSLLSFVLGWTATSFTAGGGGASQESVSQLTARIAIIESYLQQNSIGNSRVPTKPTPGAPTRNPVVKPPVTASKKASPPTKAPENINVIKKGASCKPGATDPAGKLECKLDSKKKKSIWVTKPLVISSTPLASPTPSGSKSPNQQGLSESPTPAPVGSPT